MNRKYRVHTLDVLDGEVNDIYKTGDTVFLPPEPENEEVRKALLEVDRLSNSASIDIQIEEEDDIFVYCQDVKKYLLKPEGDTFYCDCGNEMDKDCYGNFRCDICEGPCTCH